MIEFDPFSRPPDYPSKISLDLLRGFIDQILLPHPMVVSQFDGAVWPVIRNFKKRFEISSDHMTVFDDNTIARWALLWTHGFVKTGFPKGWSLAHIWPTSKDPNGFTHLANLCLIPEGLSSLTDKDGPLATFLRWHSFSVYKWQPSNAHSPQKPDAFDTLHWAYLPFQENARKTVSDALHRYNSKAAASLRLVTKQ